MIIKRVQPCRPYFLSPNTEVSESYPEAEGAGWSHSPSCMAPKPLIASHYAWTSSRWKKNGCNFFVRLTSGRITLYGNHTLSGERFCLLLVSKTHHNDRKWTYCVLHLTVNVSLMEILCIMLQKEVP